MNQRIVISCSILIFCFILNIIYLNKNVFVCTMPMEYKKKRNDRASNTVNREIHLTLILKREKMHWMAFMDIHWMLRLRIDVRMSNDVLTNYRGEIKAVIIQNGTAMIYAAMIHNSEICAVEDAWVKYLITADAVTDRHRSININEINVTR